jgi:hypothetical protein
VAWPRSSDAAERGGRSSRTAAVHLGGSPAPKPSRPPSNPTPDPAPDRDPQPSPPSCGRSAADQDRATGRRRDHRGWPPRAARRARYGRRQLAPTCLCRPAPRQGTRRQAPRRLPEPRQIPDRNQGRTDRQRARRRGDPRPGPTDEIPPRRPRVPRSHRSPADLTQGHSRGHCGSSTLAVEIKRRGHRIEGAKTPQVDRYGRRDRGTKDSAHLLVTVKSHELELRICEQGVGLRSAWEQQKAYYEENRLNFRLGYLPSRPTAYDKDATGRLDISREPPATRTVVVVVSPRGPNSWRISAAVST